jgi:hypothetical protein
MSVAEGFEQLQPSFVLGTGQWVTAAAEQMVGSHLDDVNQLRDHFPFYPLARGARILVPRVAALGGASFVSRQSVSSNDSLAKLVTPPEEVVISSIEGSVNLSDYPADLESYGIDQSELHVELKKIAIRIAFWKQFFRPREGAGFRGLPELVAPDQLVGLGRKLSLDDVDALARVTEAEGEMDRKVLVMGTRTFVAYARLVRSTGASMTYTTFNGRRYASHNGAPILLCDYVRGAVGEEAVDIWCMTLGLEDNGVFGVVPEGVGEGGLVLEQVQGALETASTVHRVRWYCTIVLRQPRGLAGLTKVLLGEGA